MLCYVILHYTILYYTTIARRPSRRVSRARAAARFRHLFPTASRAEAQMIIMIIIIIRRRRQIMRTHTLPHACSHSMDAQLLLLFLMASRAKAATS